jgi:hypothetical protein
MTIAQRARMIRRAVLLIAALQLACSDGPGSAADAGAPTADGAGADDAAPAGVCSSLSVHFTPVVPTVMLVVDRSGSMRADYGGPSRWNALYTTLMDPTSGIVTRLADQVRFGLLLYSGHDGDPDGPCPTLHDVAPAQDNVTAIDAVYGAMDPGEGTPTGAAVAAAAPMIQSVADPGPRLLILATDGLPDTCGDPSDDSSAQARGAVLTAVGDAHDADIDTYVIGVGPDISSEHLQEVANAGRGLAPGGPDNATYYRALDAAALVDAFQEIINGARGCVFELDDPVDPDIAQGTVTLDGEPIAVGTDWHLRDGSTLELLGAACETILAGGEHTVEASFTCPAAGDAPDAGDPTGGVD